MKPGMRYAYAFILACNYAPGGNILIRPIQTESVYKTGSPCTQCGPFSYCTHNVLCTNIEQ